eukprot:gene34292-biopygen24184
MLNRVFRMQSLRTSFLPAWYPNRFSAKFNFIEEKGYSETGGPMVDTFVKKYLNGFGIQVRQAASEAQRAELVAGSRVRVYWPMDEAWYSGTVDVTSAEGLTHISYDEGGQEYLNMDKEECERW